MAGDSLNDIIIERFPSALRYRLHDRLKKVILFGSRARGDYSEKSDYDFAIIVDHRNKETEDIIDEVSGDFLYHYSELIGPIIWDEIEWEERKHFPIGLNIMREGIEL